MKTNPLGSNPLLQKNKIIFQPDILSQFKEPQKPNQEIRPAMDTATISAIISDRLIELVKKDLKKKK